MNFFLNIKNFVSKCIRVWHITKKPTYEEFKLVTKISAIGILILGFIGFLIAIIFQFFTIFD